jgi:hypothetical protein
LAPDVQDGTIILVEPSAFQDTKQIGANSWNLPRLLAGIYDFPKEWSNPPGVYRLIPGWQNYIVDSDGFLQLKESTTSATASLYKNVKAADVIMIQSNKKVLSRSPGSLRIDQEEIAVKGFAMPALMPFPHGPIYRFLFEDPVQK